MCNHNTYNWLYRIIVTDSTERHVIFSVNPKVTQLDSHIIPDMSKKFSGVNIETTWVMADLSSWLLEQSKNMILSAVTEVPYTKRNI